MDQQNIVEMITKKPCEKLGLVGLGFMVYQTLQVI